MILKIKYNEVKNTSDTKSIYYYTQREVRSNGIIYQMHGRFDVHTNNLLFCWSNSSGCFYSVSKYIKF
jgi:hypothetical protein